MVALRVSRLGCRGRAAAVGPWRRLWSAVRGGAQWAENWLSWSASGAAGRWRRLVFRGCGGGVAAAVAGRARRRPAARAAVVGRSRWRLAFFVGRRGVALRGSAGRQVMGGACRGGRFIVWSTVPGFCLRKLRLVLTIGSEAVS